MPDDGSITAPYAKEDQGFDAEGNPVYCICRGPDTESKMINCAGCNDWFHITCMGFSESQVDDLMEDYYCPACTTDTKFTKFRKLCRWANIHKKFPKIPDCSKPARVEINSKYCSEAHGIAFWKFVANVALRQTMDPSNGGVMNTQEFSRIVLSTKKLCVLKGLGEKPAFVRQPASDTRRFFLSHSLFTKS
jgi:COMPASS component SPP1